VEAEHVSAEAFVDYQPQSATLVIIEQANAIADEYRAQGFTLTLRQLFYQFVARALLENTKATYARLGDTIRKARNGGLFDWDLMEDRSREVRTHSWNSPAEIIRGAARSYRENPWLGQEYRPEVWIEKDALIGVIEDICTEFRVPYYAHRATTA
jgi:hypothetical protein